MKAFTALLALALFVLIPNADAVSVGKKEKDVSVEAQLAAFRVHEDFEVNLFADESMGIANPVAMHWDSRGRLWVLTTLTYAQLEPGETANDTLVILEDTDADGRADKSTVFADGLEMPMGFALTEGGRSTSSVYLGEGPDLLLLEDTDGDGRADTREVLLTGFGTGDTHQNISNFTWGPEGNLYFSQGLHCFSRVETPWGIVRGDQAGFWRFQPDTLKLEPFCFPSLASQNPCGIVFDKTGALFIKSNNKELIFATPGLIPTTHEKNLAPIGNIGSTPGKSMGGEYVDSPHLPDWIQNNILIAGYYSHRVSAFELVPDGSGYAKVTPVEILASSHSSFRPVEIRIGPDGAIYVADWFNPIIGHYQASLRHPDRDEEHGRVWRVTAKGRELQRPILHGPSRSGVEDKIPVWDAHVTMNLELPRHRLNIIIEAANSDDPKAIPIAMRALNYPRDRFIDYALEQTVHALASHWIPAFESGEISFEKSDHLAFALQTLGGEDSLRIARTMWHEADLSSDVRVSLASVLASSGGPKDLLVLIEEERDRLAILESVATSASTRKVTPARGFVAVLKELCQGESLEERLLAIRLAGLWKAKGLTGEVRAVFENLKMGSRFHVEAAKALARIEGVSAVPELLTRFETADGNLKAGLVEAVLSLSPGKAATAIAPDLASVDNPTQALPYLRPFLSRKGGPQQLALALRDQKISHAAAGHLASALSQSGRSDEELLGLLHDAMGLAAGERAYSADFVKKLVAEVKANGNSEAGKSIYQRAELTCVACHQIEKQGGLIGPSLDTVGAGLSMDLLVESVFWPQRQLKEGYLGVAVTTKGGDTFSGYRDREVGGVFYLRDTASGEVKPIQRAEIAKFDNIGSLMPPGLTKALKREELRDLIAYLASLKG